VSKPVNNQNLLESINKAIKQDRYNKNNLKKINGTLAKIKTLTPRENEVMEHMLTGKTTRMIAQEIGISPKTVELHRSKVLKKMQVQTSTELISMMLKAPVAL